MDMNQNNDIKGDLAWLGRKESLIESGGGDLSWLPHACASLQKQPQELTGLEVARQGPLGRYVERLFEQALAFSPQVDRWHANLRGMEEKITRGEFDFIYQILGQWFHLELAVKFYIGVGDLTNPYNWHGPAARDSLGRKDEHLNSHQLLLSRTTVGMATLNALDISTVSIQKLILGRLFYPFEVWSAADFISPSMVEPTHPKGWWLTHGQVFQHSDFARNSWSVLDKPQWLCFDSHCNNPVYSNLQEITQIHDRPVMVAASEDQKRQNIGFLIPNDWTALK
jgi:hypothetical protein